MTGNVANSSITFATFSMLESYFVSRVRPESWAKSSTAPHFVAIALIHGESRQTNDDGGQGSA